MLKFRCPNVTDSKSRRGSLNSHASSVVQAKVVALVEDNVYRIKRDICRSVWGTWQEGANPSLDCTLAPTPTVWSRPFSNSWRASSAQYGVAWQSK